MPKVLLSTMVLLAGAASMSAQTAGNYASVDGLKIYYEAHGPTTDKSPPLILLHGGVGGIEMFGPNLPALRIPRSEWWTSPGSTRPRPIALFKASTVRSDSSVVPSAQPITRREKASSITARYTNSHISRM